MEKANKQRRSDRKSLIGAVTRPLNFLALTVVVCEAIIGIVCIQSNLTADQQFFVLKGMLFLLGCLICVGGFLLFIAQRDLSSKRDAVSALILEELDDEERWNRQFADSADALAKLGQEALEEHRAGKTLPLDPEKL